MCWELYAFKMPQGVQAAHDIPGDYKPPVIGPRADVIATIKANMPMANLADPSWGILDGDGWSIEINISAEDDCNGINLQVRGGDGAIAAIGALLDCTGLDAIDLQAGELFDRGPAALESLAQWRAFRAAAPKP